MENTQVESLQKDIEELEKFILDSQRPNIGRILKEQHTLLQSQLKSEKEKQEKEKSEKTEGSTSTVNSKINYITLTKYAFENSDKFAKIYFTDGFSGIKSHPTEKVVATFHAGSFEICVHDWNGKNLRFACGNLNKSISPEGSYVKQQNSALVVYLKKDKQEFWDGLEKKKSMLGDTDKIGKDKSDDPTAGLMNMMKEMYQNGDENTKRMIAESWQKAQDGKGMGGDPMGGMGGMPGMGGMGGMPGMGGMGGMPGMGGMGGFGGMPGMGGMGEEK